MKLLVFYHQIKQVMLPVRLQKQVNQAVCSSLIHKKVRHRLDILSNNKSVVFDTQSQSFDSLFLPLSANSYKEWTLVNGPDHSGRIYM